MKIILLIVGITLVMQSSYVFAQTSQQEKDQKKLQKSDKKELIGDIKAKATQQAKKQAKKFQKEGYSETAGALPMDKQLDEAWMKQYEKDDIGYPKYIVANAKITGTNYEGAKNQALNLAKTELAGLIATQVAGLAENSVANQDLSKDEAATLVKTVDASKNMIAQDLGRVIPLFEIYKTLPNKNVTVQVRIAYNIGMAEQAVREKIVKKLEDETTVAHEKLEKMMGMDKFKDFKKNSNVEEDNSKD